MSSVQDFCQQVRRYLHQNLLREALGQNLFFLCFSLVMAAFSLNIREELALIRTFKWHTKRDEISLRRKMVSLQLKIEQSRNQLRGILKFMKQHQNGIDVHLKKLSKTELTLREQIDNIFIEKPHHLASSKMEKKQSHRSRRREPKKHKSTKRAKKLNSDLIEIVQHRNDLEQRDTGWVCPDSLHSLFIGLCIFGKGSFIVRCLY